MTCRTFCCRPVSTWSGSGSGQSAGSAPSSGVVLVIRGLRLGGHRQEDASSVIANIKYKFDIHLTFPHILNTEAKAGSAGSRAGATWPEGTSGRRSWLRL